jgi:hypothetical protein
MMVLPLAMECCAEGRGSIWNVFSFDMQYIINIRIKRDLIMDPSEYLLSHCWGIQAFPLSQPVYKSQIHKKKLITIILKFRAKSKHLKPILASNVYLFAQNCVHLLQYSLSYNATPTKGHPSYQANFQMHWDSKILENWERPPLL